MIDTFEKPENFVKLLTTLLRFSTQEEIAYRLGLSRTTIGRYARGKNIPYVLARRAAANIMTLMLLEKLENLPDSSNGKMAVS